MPLVTRTFRDLVYRKDKEVFPCPKALILVQVLVLTSSGNSCWTKYGAWDKELLETKASLKFAETNVWGSGTLEWFKTDAWYLGYLQTTWKQSHKQSAIFGTQSQ